MGGSTGTPFLAMVLIVLVAVAEARPEGTVHPDSKKKRCHLKCFLKCLWDISNPVAFTACLGVCMFKCQFSPSDVVMGCTTNCANHALHNYRPDAEMMRDFVDNCYDSCKHKK